MSLTQRPQHIEHLGVPFGLSPTANLAGLVAGPMGMQPTQAENLDFIAHIIKNASSEQLVNFGNEVFRTLGVENIALKAQLATFRCVAMLFFHFCQLTFASEIC